MLSFEEKEMTYDFEFDDIYNSSYNIFKKNKIKGKILNYNLKDKTEDDFIEVRMYSGSSMDFVNTTEIKNNKEFEFDNVYSVNNSNFKYQITYKIGNKEYIVLPSENIFSDNIALIGPTSKLDQDFFPTPYNTDNNLKRVETTPGVEIHANALHTIMENNFIKKLNNLLEFMIFILIGLISYHIFKRVSFLYSSFILFFILFILTYINYYIFEKYNLWFNLSSKFLFVFLLYIYIIFKNLILENKDKSMIKNMFGSYVSPKMIELMIQDPAKWADKTKVDEVLISIFFSDIRSFTVYCEPRKPAEVVSILNEYLSAMTDIILKYDGTVDKFVGDEIMAVWGTPIPQKDHVELSIRATIEMFVQIRYVLQIKWKEDGIEPFEIGAGINTGSVISGNMGSTKKQDYTVIGDSVNLAARLEAATRDYDNYFVISEFTYEYVKDIVLVKPLGSIVVKGKSKPVDVYEPTHILYDEKYDIPELSVDIYTEIIDGKRYVIMPKFQDSPLYHKLGRKGH
jgi:class 3 adenylate cyclase